MRSSVSSYLQRSVVLTAVVATFYVYIVALGDDRLPHIALEVVYIIALAPLIEGAIYLLSAELSFGLVAVELKKR